MKLIYLLFTLVTGEKIIKNINIPSCRNCIYYKPSILDSNFDSKTLSKCEKFGEKDIITNKITYEYVTLCRNDESKCGEKGVYFEEEPNIDMKIVQHKILSNIPLILLMTSCLFIRIIPNQ